MSRASLRGLTAAAPVLALLAIWHLAVVASGSLIFPTPVQVAAGLIDLARQGLLLKHVVASLFRVTVGYLLAVALAVPVGMLMGWFASVHTFLNPLVQGLRPISPIAWIPLAVLWFGIGLSGKIFIIFIGSFFPVLLNTIAGVRGVPPILITAARTFGCSPLQLTTRVCIPAALPTIATGLRIAFGTAWMTIIAAEMVASKSGLGHMIIDGMEILRSDVVIVGMAAIGVLGFLFDALFRNIEERLKER